MGRLLNAYVNKCSTYSPGSYFQAIYNSILRSVRPGWKARTGGRPIRRAEHLAYRQVEGKSKGALPVDGGKGGKWKVETRQKRKIHQN